MKINEKNLIYFATAEPYDKCGYLNKRGEVNRAWQKRWFILKGNLLFYFEKRYDKEPIGMIILEGCTVEMAEAEAGSDQYCFKIIFHGLHNRIYVLSADSQTVMESWMKALTCAGYDYMKLMVAELQRQLRELEGKTDTPIAPPRRQAPPKPTSQPPQATNVDHLKQNEGAPLDSLLSENKDPNAIVRNGQASSSSSAFQRIHEKIGAPILKEIQDYQKQHTLTSDTGAAVKPPVDGAPLIVL